MAATELLKLVKQAAVEAVDAAGQTKLCYGRVTSASPLKILVDNKLSLSSEFLIVPQHLTDYKVEMVFDTATESGGGEEVHTHGFKGTKEVIVKSALKTGEHVMLMGMQGGQSYLVIGRV